MDINIHINSMNMVLGTKEFIRHINESEQQIIYDQAEIENRFELAAKEKVYPTDYREKFAEDTNPKTRQAAADLLQCEVSTNITKPIIDAVDLMFEQYVKNEFRDYAENRLSDMLSDFDGYDDFRDMACADSEVFNNILEAFFEETCIFTRNLSIYIDPSDFEIIFYCDELCENDEIGNEWYKAKDEVCTDGLDKTYDMIYKCYDDALDEFSADDWMSETESIFGGEAGYWRYKGI